MPVLNFEAGIAKWRKDFILWIVNQEVPVHEIKLASALNVPLEDLQQYDNRGPIADLKRLMDSDPKLGFAFRTAVEK